jgi:gliding motility-associated-like protein
MFLPTAFTPNSDSRNDEFRPGYSNILKESYQMIIFDRWGREIFKTSVPESGWNGDGFPQGVYPYRVTFKDREGNPRQIFGSVTLIR